MAEDLRWLGTIGLGTKLAGYRIKSQLGVGGMGVVFRAQDERLDRTVALKVMAPQWAGDPEFRRRFILESRAAAAVDDPHVIPIYEAGEANGLLFIAMRLVTGSDLRGTLRRDRRMEPSRALDLLAPVASALDAAHDVGLIHRDVKPENILVDERPGRPDHVYLSDFGLSKRLGPGATSITGTGEYLGTPFYSSPEQCRRRPLDGRSDQYALACLAYEMLTGHVPFEQGDAMSILLAHVTEDPPLLTERRPGFPAAADSVMATALSKSPDDRHSTCLDFIDALRDAFGTDPCDVQDASPVPLDAPRADRVEDAVPAYRSEIRGSGRWREGGIREKSGLGSPSAMSRSRSLQSTENPSRKRVTVIVAAVIVVIAAAIIIPVAFLGAPDPVVIKKPEAFTRISPAEDGVDMAASSPDGRIIAVADGGTHDYLLDGSTRRITARFDDRKGAGANDIAISPKGDKFAVADQSGHAYVWGVGGRPESAVLTDPPGEDGTTVNSVAFSPDGRTIATGGNEITNGYSNPAEICLWNAGTHRLIATLDDPGVEDHHGADVNSVAFSPDGRMLADADDWGNVYLWSSDTHRVTVHFVDPDSNVAHPAAGGVGGATSVAFSPDGRTVVTGDGNGNLYLWNASTGNLTATLDASVDKDSVASVKFSPDGRTIAMIDHQDKGSYVYLWDVASREHIATLSDTAMTSIDFSSKGREILTADAAGFIALWRF